MLFCLSDGLEKGSKQTQDATIELKKQLGDLAASGKVQQQKLTEMSSKIAALEGKQTALGGSLDQLSRDTEQKTQTIDETITMRSKWYGAAIAFLLLLLGGCYWYLRRRNDASEQSLSAQVKSAMDTQGHQLPRRIGQLLIHLFRERAGDHDKAAAGYPIQRISLRP